MATAVSKDPFHCFRFAPRVGYDGEAMGCTKVELHPGQPWQGPGEVVLASCVKEEMIQFAQINSPISLIVGVFHITDDFSSTGDPSLKIVLANVVPSRCRFEMDHLDASSSEILQMRLRMQYDRLTFLFRGGSGDNTLDMMAAVI